MENNSEIDFVRWVEDRLATLAPPVGWEPDAAMGLQRFRRARDSRGKWGGSRAWVGAILAAACVCALAFPATRVFAQRCVNACLAEKGLAGELLRNRVPATEGLMPSGRRKLAPDFTLPDASGNSVRLSEFRGRVVLLNFWAAWCAPCKAEIPWFIEVQRKYRDAGFVVLGVSLDEDGWKSVRPYIEEKKIDYRVMVGSDEIARKYGGVESLPTTFLIDKAGRIASMQEGLVETYEEDRRIGILVKEK